jgi:hypothetical protein
VRTAEIPRYSSLPTVWADVLPASRDSDTAQGPHLFGPSKSTNNSFAPNATAKTCSSFWMEEVSAHHVKGNSNGKNRAWSILTRKQSLKAKIGSFGCD